MFQRIGHGKINIFLWGGEREDAIFLFLSRHIFLTKIFFKITKKGEIPAMKITNISPKKAWERFISGP